MYVFLLYRRGVSKLPKHIKTKVLGNTSLVLISYKKTEVFLWASMVTTMIDMLQTVSYVHSFLEFYFVTSFCASV